MSFLAIISAVLCPAVPCHAMLCRVPLSSSCWEDSRCALDPQLCAQQRNPVFLQGCLKLRLSPPSRAVISRLSQRLQPDVAEDCAGADGGGVQDVFPRPHPRIWGAGGPGIPTMGWDVPWHRAFIGDSGAG